VRLEREQRRQQARGGCERQLQEVLFEVGRVQGRVGGRLVVCGQQAQVDLGRFRPGEQGRGAACQAVTR